MAACTDALPLKIYSVNLHQPSCCEFITEIYICPQILHHANGTFKNSTSDLDAQHSPFDDEADPVALVQDAFELGDAVGAGSLEGDLVGDADDLHGPWVAGYFAVGDRHHVI